MIISVSLVNTWHQGSAKYLHSTTRASNIYAICKFFLPPFFSILETFIYNYILLRKSNIILEMESETRLKLRSFVVSKILYSKIILIRILENIVKINNQSFLSFCFQFLWYFLGSNFFGLAYNSRFLKKYFFLVVLINAVLLTHSKDLFVIAK